MKKLVSLLMWFCAATLLAQAGILTLSYLRGNLNGQTFTQLIALLNGIDIQGGRLQAAIQEGDAPPPPTREEMALAAARLSLEMDAREDALRRMRESLEAMQKKLQADIVAFDVRRVAFEDSMAARNQSAEAASLAEVQRILTLMPPDQAKDQLVRMMDSQRAGDVIAIIKALPEDVSKKILEEMTTEPEQEKLQNILQLIRTEAESPPTGIN